MTDATNGEALLPDDVIERCRTLSNEDLMDCALQVYARHIAYGTESQHNAAMAYRAELLRRLSAVTDSQGLGEPGRLPLHEGHITVTEDGKGNAVAVTLQDDDHRWLAVIWTRDQSPPADTTPDVSEPTDNVEGE